MDELLAFTQALRERAKALTPPDEASGVLDCAGLYDGRSHSFGERLTRQASSIIRITSVGSTRRRTNSFRHSACP
ncbi:hypothetical protein [Alicyclobacillus herbarius]|uniref:hypothetical protein n=1 Tax=Alicyclobacillus herbarius TaxID=122960 RepID=UPI001FE13BEF|nr:hypothetical protein [Alicyclobacillus herbarius]